jgi:hypothetical protein
MERLFAIPMDVAWPNMLFWAAQCNIPEFIRRTLAVAWDAEEFYAMPYVSPCALQMVIQTKEDFDIQRWRMTLRRTWCTLGVAIIEGNMDVIRILTPFLRPDTVHRLWKLAEDDPDAVNVSDPAHVIACYAIIFSVLEWVQTLRFPRIISRALDDIGTMNGGDMDSYHVLKIIKRLTEILGDAIVTQDRAIMDIFLERPGGIPVVTAYELPAVPSVLHKLLGKGSGLVKDTGRLVIAEGAPGYARVIIKKKNGCSCGMLIHLVSAEYLSGSIALGLLCGKEDTHMRMHLSSYLRHLIAIDPGVICSECGKKPGEHTQPDFDTGYPD